MRSTNDPAGASAMMRVNRSALRISPTRNGEIPSTAPRSGRIGKTTTPHPTREVLAVTDATTERERRARLPTGGQRE